MKLSIFLHSCSPVFVALLCSWFSASSESPSGRKTNEISYSTVDLKAGPTTASRSLFKSTVPTTVVDAEVDTVTQRNVFPDETENAFNDSSIASVADSHLNQNTTVDGNVTDSDVLASNTEKANSTRDSASNSSTNENTIISNNSEVESASNSTTQKSTVTIGSEVDKASTFPNSSATTPAITTNTTTTVTSTESTTTTTIASTIDTTTTEETTTSTNSSGATGSRCHEACYCPNYQGWAARLVPYLRRHMGPRAHAYTDDVIKIFLLQQFALNAESSKSILGILFEKVMSEGDPKLTLSLWWARFGITMCRVEPNTTFYLDSETEAKLFPQVLFKDALINQLAAALDPNTGSSANNANPVESVQENLQSHQLYNITFVCKEGSKVVVTKEASLFRYGIWRSTGCQVSTEGILTLDRNWSLVELHLTNENALWFQNVTVSDPKKNNTMPNRPDQRVDVQPGNTTTAKNSLQTLVMKRDTVFPSIRELYLINTSLSLRQLGRVLVWFQKAQELSLKNNSLTNFNCSQLIPSPAVWTSLDISFSGLTSIPACLLRPSLESLDLSNNIISNISVIQLPNYVPSTKLDLLNLSNNDIRDIGIITNLNLTFLYLAGNKITHLNKLSFTRLPELSVLDLSRNHLHRLDPGSFKTLTYLQILDLQHNYLQQFDRSVSPLRLNVPLDCKIYLSHNRFSHPPFQSERYNPGFSLHVYATGNPFACDCDMVTYVEETKNSSLTDSYSDRSDMHCKYPPQLEGVPLDDIVFTDTCPVVSDCPRGCACNLHRNDSIVTVDCSDVEEFQFPEALPQAHQLHLEFQSANETQTFSTFQDSEYLQRAISINASGRGLTHVPSFLCESLKHTEVLDLSFNKLQRLPSCFQSRPKNWPILDLRLAHNPWTCSCSNTNLSSWLSEMMRDGSASRNGVVVSDVREIRCGSSGNTEPGGELVAEWDASHCELISYLPWAVALGVILALAAVLGPLLYVYRLQAMVAIHARFHVRPFSRAAARHFHEEDFDHEALVVHGKSDTGLDWVLHALLPRTERTRHRLCVPERDFLPGTSIGETYASVVPRCKSSVCLLSSDCAQDEWWLYAFQLARAEQARDPHRKLLMVVLEEEVLKQDARLSEEVREFLKTNTYLSLHDRWFWEKLFYYLPDPPKLIPLP